jgi:hypothetical protein
MYHENCSAMKTGNSTILYYNSSIQLGQQGAIFRMGGRLRQVGWRGGNTSSSEGTSSWSLPMAYIQPAANTHTQITSRGRGGGERQRIAKRISYIDKAAGWTDSYYWRLFLDLFFGQVSKGPIYLMIPFSFKRSQLWVLLLNLYFVFYYLFQVIKNWFIFFYLTLIKKLFCDLSFKCSKNASFWWSPRRACFFVGKFISMFSDCNHSTNLKQIFIDFWQSQNKCSMVSMWILQKVQLFVGFNLHLNSQSLVGIILRSNFSWKDRSLVSISCSSL